ncbi:FliM/FliN family flagellar motor switch protein [Bacillus toyonensis]|uniref:FliM/FliN family flagellar motor switch protein n=1 Tax=Bacillus toyonensis TaxID=155322 RepID=UPI002E1C4D70|nr:FliM/FliN family flagellar motor switch protein [Bacillus toyonensis]
MTNENNNQENTKDVNPVILEELEHSINPDISLKEIEKLGDVELPVRVLFASIIKKFEEVLSMSEGEVIPLNRFAGEFVDVVVDDRVVAKAEIVVIDDSFGVRLAEILPSDERLAPSRLED